MTEPGVRPTGSDAGLKLWDGIVKLGLGLRVILLPMSPGLERHPTLVSLPGKVNSSMNRFLTALAVAVLNLGAVSPASAQARGIELFRTILTQPLTPITGPTELSWLPAGMGYLEAAGDSATGRTFYRVDPVTGKKTRVFDARTEAKIIAEFARLTGTSGGHLPFDAFKFERGGGAISFAAGGDHFLHDLATGKVRKLLVPKNLGPLDQATPDAGVFSPDFNYYAFIRDYDNLYLFDTRTGRETRLTTGTSENNLIGFLGAGAWFVWSPDSRRIAYLKADQRAIYKYPLLRDLDRHATVDYQRYPFTGDPNPSLEFHVIDVASNADVKVAASTEEQPYFRNIAWFDDGSEVTFQVVNQWENRLELKAADAASGQVRTVLVDEDSTYLDELHNFRQLKDGKRFTWSSERSGWRHLYLYDRQGTMLRQLTSGEWDTGQIDGIDEAGGWVYFEGATNFGLEQPFFRVRLDGTGLTKLTPEPGVHRISMDPGAAFFTDAAAALSAAPAVTLRAADGKAVRTLATTNTDAVTKLGLVAPELLTLKAADGVSPLHGILYKPADFDPSKRYPLIVNVYGGPHTKAVRDGYQTTDVAAALAQLGFLVAQFDGRGTIDRGKRWQAGSYLRLGQTDVDDQAAAVRQLRSRPYLDSLRVGVTGISHGGFMTIMMMVRYPDVYQVGAAGAPITDVRNGPHQYIGRIMRTPQANPDGYAKADLLTYAPNLKGRLLIYHGTNDQNAVIGNTMQFVRKLIDAGRPVDMMIYPNGIHVLEGLDAIHGLKTMVSYFLEHLRPEGWEQSRTALW